MRRRRKVQRTNRDREVQMIAGRLVAVSHHRRVNRLAMAGTLVGQSPEQSKGSGPPGGGDGGGSSS